MEEVLKYVFAGGLLLVAFLISRAGRGLAGRGVERAAGICNAALDQTVRKRANKEKILALFETKQELSNAELREALGVSRRSVVNYTDELEREGKLEQIGAAGHAVTYRLRQ